jgi:chromate transporter
MTLLEIFTAFLKLGLISFGGPVAHISYFHQEFVLKRQWLDEAAFGDLLALCQFLPGPASSQMVFAIGMRRAGLPGALVASLCFTLPSAILMILFGYGISALGDLNKAGWLHGLKLAAVAVVAQAVWTMGRKLCPDRARQAIGLGAATVILAWPGSFSQIGSIILGAILGWSIYRGEIPSNGESAKLPIRAHMIAGACFLVYLSLLFLLPVAAAATHSKMLAVFDGFYRAGALVFGGGHVVLPLLRTAVVPKGWVTDDAFLAGYGAAQALPGPLFTFSAYLGTVMSAGPRAFANGLWCLLAIFLPAWLVLGGTLPFWDELRKKPGMQAALRGTNAAVVGVLLAALYTPVITQGIRTPGDVGLVLVAFGLLETFKVPAWLVVVLAACAGQFLLG